MPQLARYKALLTGNTVHCREMQCMGGLYGGIPMGEAAVALPRCYFPMTHFTMTAKQQLTLERLAIRCLNTLKITVN
jgi:hypothetical protein